jgi:uncharacterized protein (DUF736 family)
MATIGTFTQDDAGNFNGSIKTLTLNVKQVQIRKAEASDNDKAPDYRIFTGKTEFGAAWKKISKAGDAYLSLKLDDPSFAGCMYASLVDAEEGYSLIWSRSRIAD